VQYACGDYIQRLEPAGIQPNMSRAGCPWDNAMAESWMRTLKREEVDGRVYRDLAAATASIGQFIEKIHNRQRLHSALAYLAPEAYEASQLKVLGLPHAASPAPVAAVCGEFPCRTHGVRSRVVPCILCRNPKGLASPPFVPG
jgi:putative transposase